MDKDSLLDKIIFWFKNNKFFSVIILLSVVIIAVANVFNSVDNIFQKGKQMFSSSDAASQNTNEVDDSSDNTSKNAFAAVEFEFGGKGNGAGKFNDPRLLGIDKKGNICVGEYGGRIQAFDSLGNFITEWNLPNLTGLAVSRNGIVYACANDSFIRTYNSATGAYLDSLQTGLEACENVVLAADGSIIGSSFASDDITSLDNKGRIALQIKDAIRSQTGDDEDIEKIAVDGIGDIYAVGGSIKNFIYKFSASGKFINKFGGLSDAAYPHQPDQLGNPNCIAVDSKGRIFVSDWTDIKIFDADGRYITTFKMGITFRSLVFNDKDELYGVTTDFDGSKVIKYKTTDIIQ